MTPARQDASSAPVSAEVLDDQMPSRPDAVELAPVSSSVSVVLFGTLAWLGWVWVLVAVGYAIALTAISIWGSIDSSLWGQAAAGWQRWPVAAAGFTAVCSFAPMLLTNGVTRRRAAHAFGVTGACLALIGAGIVVVGFGVESIVYDNNGWEHTVDEVRDFDDVGLPRVGLSFALIFLAYYVAGWLVALAYQRLGWLVVMAVPFAAIPVVVGELTLMTDGPGTQFEVLNDAVAASTSLWIGVLLTAVVVALAYRAAVRWTADITVDP